MQTVAVLVGLQASGKTTFCRTVLGPAYEHVSKDHFPNSKKKQQRQMRLIIEVLESGRNVAVDNTNPSPAEWAPLVEVARRHGARVVAYWFPPDFGGSVRRNSIRGAKTRVPDVGLKATAARLQQPSPADGFDEVLTVRFDGRGGFEVSPANSSG